MYWRPESLLDAMRHRIPEGVVGAHEFASCRRVAERLPLGTRSFYLECRLSEASRVDFLALLGRRHGAGQRMRQSRAGLLQSAVWERNFSLLHGWEARTELQDAPLIWFEFDIDDGFDFGRQDASPSVCVEPGYCMRMLGTAPAPSDQSLALASFGMGLVLNPEQLRDSVEGIQRVVDALPAAGSLIYVSPTYSRKEMVIKLYVSLPKRAVIDYLRRLDWPGDVRVLADVLTAQYRVAETAFLDLSWSGGALPRLGLAFSQLHRAELGDGELDSSFDWVPLSGTSAEKRDALRGWPGLVETRIDGLRTWIRTWLDHKLVVTEHGELESKAYLGFMPSLPPPFA